MEPRLATSLLVTALVRKAESDGGNGAVLAKGDANSGSVIVVLTEKGANPRILERVLQPDGRYAWSQGSIDPTRVPELIARGRRFDPDLWVLELDIPSAERFAAEMIGFD